MPGDSFCIIQLITLPESRRVYLYFKSGKIGSEIGKEERLDEWENVDDAVREFTRLFEEQTGNEFEAWEREKKIQKEKHKLYPIDMVWFTAFLSLLTLARMRTDLIPCRKHTTKLFTSIIIEDMIIDCRMME